MKQIAQATFFFICTLLMTASAIHAAPPEQVCQEGRYAAAAKYSACVQKAAGKTAAGGYVVQFREAFSKCRVKYTATWTKLQKKAAGTGASCDAPRFAVSGGVVTDKLTGLQWEQKTDDASIHDKDDTYSWSAGGSGFTAADGTAFTSFLATLNSGGCFGGQCDWRLPTFAELGTILSEAYPCTTSPAPCIDEGVFGPTFADYYWTPITSTTDSGTAWCVDFTTGVPSLQFKDQIYGHVRAVREGL